MKNDFDENGYKTCPDCEGAGYNKKVIEYAAYGYAYEYWHLGIEDEKECQDWAEANWQDFIEDAQSFLTKCPKCKGSGRIDWVTNVMNPE